MIRRLLKIIIPEKYHAWLSAVRTRPAYLGRLFRPKTYLGSKVFYYLVIALNPVVAISRFLKSLELNKVAEWKIPDDDGYLVADTRDLPVAQKCLEKSRELAGKINFEHLSKTSKKPFLIEHLLDLDDPENLAIVEYALSPGILGTISSYIGSLPALLSAGIWHSNGEDVGERSQLFHLDTEDVRTVTIFLHLDDVDEDTRPFTLIPARESFSIYKRLNQAALARGGRENRGLPKSPTLFFSRTQISNPVSRWLEKLEPQFLLIRPDVSILAAEKATGQGYY